MIEKRVDVLLAAASACTTASFGLIATIYLEFRSAQAETHRAEADPTYFASQVPEPLWWFLGTLAILTSMLSSFLFIRANDLTNH